jgi:DNA-binding CsgD family transcriptional regulator/tetratricopeptide (TPR) repeat protein
MSQPAPALPHLPLVGRTEHTERLRAAIADAAEGRGGTLFLAGESGVGKTRLARMAAEEMARRGGIAATGRCYPMETGVPYSSVSDALGEILRGLEPASLATLTRGGEAELASLFPSLAPAQAARPALDGDPAELKTRLLWSFTQFLGRLAARRPLLLVLEDLQWADPSSLELLHFAARQVAGRERVLVLCTYNPAERDRSPGLRAAEQSLLGMGAARTLAVGALTHGETAALVREAFGVEDAATRELVALLYGWTRGNPFFVEETLKTLVETGKLRAVEGAWLGWEVDALELPRTVRDSVLGRMDRLPSSARAVADVAAVVGARVSYAALEAVSDLAPRDLLAALDELRRARILVEAEDRGEVVYDFAHPVLRDALYTELGLARARTLHAAVAEALERFYGPAAPAHADELALHFVRSGSRLLAAKAARYLAAAGRNALARHANREAAEYLSGALEHSAGGEEGEDAALVEDLARVRQRLGEHDAAIELWRRSLHAAEKAGDARRVASLRRRTGLASYWSGRHGEALAEYDAGLAAAEAAGDDTLLARLRIAKGMCLQELGRLPDAQREVAAALLLASHLADPALLARAHRALLLLYTWTGPPDLARAHGDRAVELAGRAGDRSVACSTHWAMAMVAGLTGDSAAVARHLEQAERLADELNSPLWRLWISEIAIEYAAGMGEWDSAVALAERSIALARRLGQKNLLPRLLVWAGLVYLGQGRMEAGERCVAEAWELAAAGRDGPLDVHTAVPAHTGIAALHLARGEYERAIEVGMAGVEIADRSGYVVWAIHRLLPVVAEAALWLRDAERAGAIGRRLRKESERLGHKLGLAWADTCDALVLRLSDRPGAIALLRSAVEELEAIPFPVDAARLRRQLGEVMGDSGDREGAIRELRRAHDVFARVGAGPELANTRENLRELGARPPARTLGLGAAGLTGREADIARRAAAGESNKQIGRALGLSPRTVGTHLSNIFRKLEVGSRHELVEIVRRMELPEA